MKYIFGILFFLFVLLQSAISQLKKDSINRVGFAAIPMINYSPSFGLNLGAIGQMFYKVNLKDTISPSSSTGILGLYTTNKTYFLAGFQKMYWNDDKWRMLVAGGNGNINFQFWQEMPSGGEFYPEGGTFIDFNTYAVFAVGRIERKVYKKLYAGLNGKYSMAETDYYFPGYTYTEKVNMSNIGYQLNYDVREHQINPYGGYNIEFVNTFSRDWINSSYNFEVYKITYNHYYKIKNERNMLVTRFVANIADGDVPFQGQSIVGQDDIRGYSNGKYRNNQVYALQAEYRWRFYKKFGMVGFAGVASAVEQFKDIAKTSLLPGVGAGFRYMMLAKERVNIGMDVAVGKDDWGMYFRIGESFGR